MGTEAAGVTSRGQVMLSRELHGRGAHFAVKQRAPQQEGCRQERKNYAAIMARTVSTKARLHSGGSWLGDFPSSCVAPVQFLECL